MNNLYTALLKAKTTFSPIVKNKTNPHFRNKYADLDSILNAVEPQLNSAGIIIVAYIHDMVDNEQPHSYYTVQLVHVESDESLDCSFPLDTALDPQKLGSYMTYYRRYAICSMLNLTADDDDDAETSNVVASEQLPNSKKSTSKVPY